MSRKAALSLSVVFALALLIVMISVQRMTYAARQAGAAEATRTSMRQDAASVLELRQRQQRIAERKRPDSDVNAQVLVVMNATGLPVARLKSLRADADVALPTREGAVRYRRQSVAVELQTITLPELGDFLLRWRQEQPLWTPSRLTLTRAAGRARTNDRYNAALTLNALYVDDSSDP